MNSFNEIFTSKNIIVNLKNNKILYYNRFIFIFYSKVYNVIF